MPREQAPTPKVIKVPRRTLLVLCGPAGSGKSTFAAQRFIATRIVASDHCRAMICDDENNQQVNRDTFDLFHYIIQKRLLLGRFTVADSTALYPAARGRLRELSRSSRYLSCLLLFNIQPDLCLARTQQRHRRVEQRVIAHDAALLQRT